MKMKRLLSFILLLSSYTAFAEDILQIYPFQTTAGVAYKDKMTMDIYLVNSFDVANLQFEILLPEGMAFSANNSEFTERAQSFDEEEDDFVDSFTWSSNLLSSGYTKVVFTPTNLVPISAGSGAILRVRYKTDASMQPGVYPILMRNIELDESVTHSLTELQAVSYVIIGEDSPLSSDANLDMSALEGYVPSFVVEAMNTDLAANTNLVSLNLSGATELGAELQVPEDALWYTATKAGQTRVFPANQWSTVCLPFGLSSSQVDGVKAMGVEIEQLSSYEGNTVKFEAVNAMTANEPYIVRSTTAQAPFASFSDVSVGELSPVAITKDNLTMTGVYEQTALNSDANTLYYIFNATDGKFSRVGTNVTVSPFRAYLHRTGDGARTLDVTHDGGSATDIMELDEAVPASDGEAVYDLQGRRMTPSTGRIGIRVKQGKKYLDY